MFERYTEKARRVVFFARYEASQFGASQIEAEHILLGLIREDKKLTARFFRRPHAEIESICKEIEGRRIPGKPISTNIDMPLSQEAKRVLSYAAEEAERLENRHIGTEHLLLGLLREEKSIAAEILYERGLRLSDIRQDLLRDPEIDRPITRKMIRHELQPAESGEKWMEEILKTCVERGLITQDDLVIEFERVAALRQFRADVEALLRLLAAKGMADPQKLLELAFELRDEKKLAEFIEKLRRI